MSGYSNLYRRERDLDMPSLAAFDEREESRQVKRLARLKAQGYTHCTCSRCGDVRTLAWVGGECNNWADNDEQVCPGIYRAAKTDAWSDYDYEPNREALAMEARALPEGRWGDE